ncbi:MAG: hypothetical protein KDB01_03390 [Planctomycetaceae bacterium]|nr:hypothetical protein [Planctomycetaceae bacterium]
MSIRILVTGSSTFFAARLIADLGRQGVQVTAADDVRFSAGKLIRTTSRKLQTPVLSQDPGRYLETILKELRQHQYDLLLPTFEESLLFSEYADDLRRHTQLFLPAYTTMMALHNKPTLHSFCQSIGVRSPHTAVVHHVDELRAIGDMIGYPVVVKLPAANNSVGRTYCLDQTQLETQFRRLHQQHCPIGAAAPFVQRKIDGDLICTLSYCNQGQKLGEVIYRTLRTFPEAGGTAAHKESIDHPVISEITARIARETNWSGFVGFDFIIDRTNNLPYIIDANVRANPAIHLGFLTGVDWTTLILNLASGKSPTQHLATSGVNVHTLLLDASWLLEGLLPSVASMRKFPLRLKSFVSPQWPVHSRDDLLGVGEFRSALAVTWQAVSALVKSVITGKQPGETLLSNANYDPAKTEAYRAQRPNHTVQHKAA